MSAVLNVVLNVALDAAVAVTVNADRVGSVRTVIDGIAGVWM